MTQQFKPTPEQRNTVAIAAGGGMSHEEIAIGLGISRPTLEKHFEEELSTGAYAKRLEVIECLFETARKGNVTAQRAFIALCPAVATVPLPAAEPALGKKEQANVDAVGAQQGTEWADLLPIGGKVVAIR